jgi:tetratricopeptide (TPR) repeat protein
MLTETPGMSSSSSERDQLERKQSAISVWREGRIADALLIINALLAEDLTPRVVAECRIAQSAFLADSGDFAGSHQALEAAAPFLDSLEMPLRASFYLQRARIRKEQGLFDAALTDYAGAEMYWRECGEHQKAGAAILNVAGCYLALGDITAVHQQVSQAKAVFLQTNSFYLSQAYDTEALAYLAEGKLEQAMESINTALRIVGDSNEKWRSEFLVTRDKIEMQLLKTLQVNTLADCDGLKVGIVRRALCASTGRPADAALILGVTRHAVESLINNHPEELEPYRMKRRIRNKTIIKKA